MLHSMGVIHKHTDGSKSGTADGSKTATLAPAAAAASVVIAPWKRDANDGTFWMSYSDFTAKFTHIYACR